MGTLRNLAWADGQANPSGIKPIAYYLSKRDITKFPKMADAPASAADESSLDGDYTLVAAKTAISLYTSQGLGKVEYESTGEKDCKMFTNKGTLSYPDLNDESKAFVNTNVNANGIWIIPHYVAGGQVRYATLGSEHFDSEMTLKGTSGDKPGSAKGTTIEISAPDLYALPNYTGTLPLPDGTLNCATGEFTPNPAA